uniref:Uncharacterized protein n=1 Tax=mine drainage metagenome TaxID=410659 RepID=E6QM57_9ZZZZ
MKPNPFALLNHLTVPLYCATGYLPSFIWRWRQTGMPLLPKTQKRLERLIGQVAAFFRVENTASHGVPGGVE